MTESTIKKQVEDYEKNTPSHIDTKTKAYYVGKYQGFLVYLATKTKEELVEIYNKEVDATHSGSWTSNRPVFLDALHTVCVERGLPPFYTKIEKDEAGSVHKSHALQKINQ